MHDDDKARVLPFVKQGGAADDEYPRLWSYDDGHQAGYRVGYRAGRADTVARYERLLAEEASWTPQWVTWGLVLAFTVGGVFGVLVCRLVWPLVAAGVIP